MHRILIAGLGLMSGLLGQSLQHTTENVLPPGLTNAVYGYSGTYYLPQGPVTFPAQVGLRQLLTATPSGVAAYCSGSSGTSTGFFSSSSSDLITTITTPSPTRIDIAIARSVNYTQVFASTLPYVRTGIDLGANGTDEFRDDTTTAFTSARLATYCDSDGTLVRWYHTFSCPETDAGYLSGNMTLAVEFTDPVLEQTYGPSCAGRLGCQLGGSPFERTFVASFPAGTSFAWLMGGSRSWFVTFPNYPCPLLVEPQFILAVPLTTGSGGRHWTDLDAAFPPLPGAQWFAQGVAVRNGTFLGTNGVIVRT